MHIGWWVLLGVIAVFLLPALRLLDRVGLWLEDRGWLYYRKKKPSSSPLSSLVAVQQFIEPGVEHVIRAGREGRAEDADREARHRLLSCLRDALCATTVNPEVVRLYLTQARQEGLPYEELYEQASIGMPAGSAPPLRDVAPLD